MTQEEKRELFGDAFAADEEAYAAEAEERWGDTEEWRESRRRTQRHTKEDWRRIQDETEDLEERFAVLLRAGTAADSPEPVRLAEEARQHLQRWFYDCAGEMQAALGRMYVEDQRFAWHYDERESGLAQFVSTACVTNGERLADRSAGPGGGAPARGGPGH